jgi:hypothetical protein
MLAVMGSLASSVPGETALTPSLLAFYATVATVIPVLLIVLAVQGATYQGMIRVMRSLRGRTARTSWRSSWSRVIAGAGVAVLLAASYVILLAGGLGEFWAIFALYQGYDHERTRLLVLLSAAVLIFMVVAGPLLELLKPRGPDPEVGQEIRATGKPHRQLLQPRPRAVPSATWTRWTLEAVRWPCRA